MTRKLSTAWRTTPEGVRKYMEARADAQRLANEFGYDYGLEANDLFKSFHVFMLRQKKNRTGFELRCEVVSCEIWDKIQPGHGP